MSAKSRGCVKTQSRQIWRHVDFGIYEAGGNTYREAAHTAVRLEFHFAEIGGDRVFTQPQSTADQNLEQAEAQLRRIMI